MCGQTASLPRVSLIALATLAAQQSLNADTIPEGFRVVPSSEPRRVVIVQGADRAESVAAHLRIANRELVSWWDMPQYTDETRAVFQAGAAATEAMADFLDAVGVGDMQAALSVIELFINDAVDTGVVTT